MKAFWLVGCCAAGVPLVVVAVAVSSAYAALAVGLATGVMAAMGYFRPPLASRPHGWWRMLTLRFASRAERALTWICYHMIILATGRVHSRLRLQRQDRTGWVDRGEVHSKPSASLYTTRTSRPGTRDPGWATRYLSWASRLVNLWAIFLFPFIWSLRQLRRERDTQDSATIYTLY